MTISARVSMWLNNFILANKIDYYGLAQIKFIIHKVCMLHYLDEKRKIRKQTETTETKTTKEKKQLILAIPHLFSCI